MQERHVEIQTPAGRMETFIVHPDGAGPFPAIVMYQNVGGLSEILRNMARRAAGEGYYVAVPDLYYRLGKIVIDPDNRDEAVMVIRGAAGRSVTTQNVIADSRAVIDHIETDAAASKGPMGIIGYCMGGRFVWQVAGSFPERIRATASLFAGRLITEEEDSAHLFLPKLQGEVYAAYAEHDPGLLPPEVEEFTKLLNACSVAQFSETHPDTHHGFAFPGRRVYHQAASELAWERIFAMLKRQLVEAPAATASR